ncbi:MAG TPA: hypothetical protein VFA09_04380 [Ktedonobacteraceae bacterium]|nr:hypothetical protein [Ktedonobacteraceae bacterium]
MQWLGVLILFGIFAFLCIAGIYLARTQKTRNTNVVTPLDDLYRSKGLGNVLDANHKLNLRSTGGQQQKHRRHN